MPWSFNKSTNAAATQCSTNEELQIKTYIGFKYWCTLCHLCHLLWHKNYCSYCVNPSWDFLITLHPSVHLLTFNISTSSIKPFRNAYMIRNQIYLNFMTPGCGSEFTYIKWKQRGRQKFNLEQLLLGWVMHSMGLFLDLIWSTLTFLHF